MTKEKMQYVRNIIVGIFSVYLILLIINMSVLDAFYLSLFINFSNRYMLFALAYFLLCRNLKGHLVEKRIFLYLVIVIFALTMSPIVFYVFSIKEFDLNDPLSSLLYINLALHFLSLYTIAYSAKMIKTLNSSKKNKKKFFYVPHIIYIVLFFLYIANDFEILSLAQIYLDALGLLGAMVLIRSITRFQYVVIE